MKKRAANRRISQATGLAGIGMLALTGCVGVDDHEAADEGRDEAGQVDADQDQPGQDQPGQNSDSAGQDDDAGDQGGDLDDEDDELADAEVPALEEIEDDVWDASLGQESVTLRSTQDQMVGGSEELEDLDDIDDIDDDTSALSAVSPQDDEPQGDDHDGDDGEIELVYTGEMTGEGSAMEFTLGDVDGTEFHGEYLSFGDTVYQSTEGFITDLLIGAPEDVEVPEREEIDDAFELDWVDHSGFETTLNHTAEQYLEEIRDSLDLLIGEDELADLDAEGSEGTHEGEDVWIYETDDVEIIVLADEEEPLLLHVDVDRDDVEASIELTEWNESEDPEEPDSDDVYSAEEAMEIVEGL